MTKLRPAQMHPPAKPLSEASPLLKALARDRLKQIREAKNS